MKKFVLLFFIIGAIAFSQKNSTIVDSKLKSGIYAKIQKNLSEQLLVQSYYDVKYYCLQLDIDPSTKVVKGNVLIDGIVVKKGLSQIDLNLTDGMNIDSVLVAGLKTTYTYSGNILLVNLNTTYVPNTNFKIKVYYNGKPSATGFGSFSFSTVSGKNVFWSLSEPFGARDWWPCKDIPEDKADSADMIITVPKEMVVASNGLLRNTTETADKKTYYWHESYPIPTYLISVAGYPYYVYKNYYVYSPTDSMQLQHYLYSDNSSKKLLCDKTLNMLKIYSDLFGQYPFIKEKYGHADCGFSGGMEHQTCTSLGAWDEMIVAHELSHQWWGDMITCKDFHHIWLNEGFATYSEALYAEKKNGTAGYKNEMNGSAYYGSGTIYVDNLNNQDRIFSSDLSYNKGSWVLHMLRHVVSDSMFFNILRTYYNNILFKYGTATTEDFQHVCESIYGKDLTWFFTEWIYGEYYPYYNTIWSKTAEGSGMRLNLRITQTQSNQVFKMPIDLTVTTAAGDTTFIIWDTLKTQEYNFYFNRSISAITLDKDGWILKKVTNILDTFSGNDSKPYEFNLEQNYPNPFNNSTKIYFTIPEKGYVKINIYDINGRKVKELSSKEYEKGRHSINFSGDGLPSGTYLYELSHKGLYERKKMILLK
jgi:aminopeptidase N